VEARVIRKAFPRSPRVGKRNQVQAAPIEAVSRALSDRTTPTIEIHYGRNRTESALAEFERAFTLREARFSK